jgi:hypothetical protein
MTIVLILFALFAPVVSKAQTTSTFHIPAQFRLFNSTITVGLRFISIVQQREAERRKHDLRLM